MNLIMLTTLVYPPLNEFISKGELPYVRGKTKERDLEGEGIGEVVIEGG